MIKEIFLAIIQSITEFLPISSSGHLALVSNLISKPNLFFFTALHLASLLAVVIFTRKELAGLFRFNKEKTREWLYLIVAAVPGALFGFLFKEKIEGAFSSYLFIGLGFIFTSLILFLTKFSKTRADSLNIRKSAIIGLFQAIALFPGVSRSGMTISGALFLGIDKEKSAKFSFLLFIPLALGAFALELGKGVYLDAPLAISFIMCLILSLVFLKLLLFILKKDKFWVFSVYTFAIGIISVMLNWRS